MTSVVAAAMDGTGLDAVLDVVAATAKQPAIFDALRPDGPKIYSQVFTGDEVKAPEGVQAAVSFGRQTFGLPGGLAAMPALAKLVEEGEYKLPVRVEVIGTGFEAIDQGLNRLIGGVSGTKLVVSL